METKEFKIQVLKGYEIDRENSTFEKIVFKKIERDLPKRWEDLEGISGFYVSSDSKVEVFKGCFTKGENKKVFPTSKEAEACLALAQLCQLRDRFNDGWKPDWEDNNVKYLLYYWGNTITKSHTTQARSLLTFKSEQLRDKFLENFKDLIEIAKPLL